MANTFKLRRGLEASRTGQTPDAGEPLWITNEQKMYVGDGSTAGGLRLNYVELDGDTLTGQLNTQNVVPATDSTYTLGTASVRWSNLYIDAGTCGGTFTAPTLTATSTVNANTITTSRTSTSSPVYSASVTSDTPTHAVLMQFTRNRVGSSFPDKVENGDAIGELRWNAADQSLTPVQAARIKLVVDGATGQDDVPTRMEFHVAADGGGNAAAVAILRSSSFDMDGSVIADHFTETTYTLSGTTPSLNPANGGIQKWTLTANSTPTDGLTDGESMLLQVTDGTAYTITWPTISWVGGSAPTLDATDETIIELWKVSTTLYGALVGVA